MVGRIASAISIVGLVPYCVANALAGYHSVMGVHVSEMAIIAANLVAFRLHRSTDVLLWVLGGALLVSWTLVVARTANLGAALAWWGVLPMAAALLARSRGQMLAWLGAIGLAGWAQLLLADPAAFRLRNPGVTLLEVVCGYGALALGYVAARERARAEVARAEEAVRELGALLPICSYCKQVRDDEGYWHKVEVYISDHTGAELTHGICPTCLDRLRAEGQARHSGD
jgi:hypothetical protein